MYITMEVDKAFVYIGEELCYKIMIQNDECYTLMNVCLIGKLPTCLSFIGGTQEGQMDIAPEMLEKGIPIGTLLRGQKQTIYIYTRLNTFPTDNPIIYTMDLFFYSEDLNEEEVVPTNTVMSLVTDPDIRMERETIHYTSDKEVVDRRDYITYTLSLKNKGNTTAKDIFIFDLIPQQTILVGDSIQFEEETIILDNSAMFRINQIKENETKTISYTVQVDQTPTLNQIVHSVGVEYNFLLANRTKVKRQEVSNEIIVAIETAYFDKEQEGFIKEVSSGLCDLEDYLTYTLRFTNLGNVITTHITVVDAIPKDMIFVKDSLTLNDNKLKGVTLKDPICLTNLQSKEQVVITYQVQVPSYFTARLGECPPAELIYSYTSSKNYKTNTIYSDAPKVNVCSPILNNYGEDKLFEIEETHVGIGDLICGNLHITNSGNIAIDKMCLAMEAREGISNLADEWVQYENILVCQIDEAIEAGSHYQIPLVLKVESLSALPALQLKCAAKYVYRLDERVVEKDLYFKDEMSITIRIAAFQDDAIKTVDKQIAQIGDLLRYTLTFKNIGNVSAKAIWVKEEDNPYLEIIPKSLQVNGVSCKGNLLEGVTISDIPSMETGIVEYVARIKEEAIPQIIEPNSFVQYDYDVSEQDKRTIQLNVVGAQTVIEEAYIVSGTESVIYQVDKQYAKVGDFLNYTLQLTNKGNKVAHNVVIDFPEIPCGRWCNHKTLTLEDIEPGASVIINTQLEVMRIPFKNTVEVSPTLSYCFNSNNKIINKMYPLASLTTRIIYACISEKDGGIVCKVKPINVTIGEIVTYSITLKNTGNTTACDIKFYTQLPEGLSYITNVKAGAETLALTQIEPDEIITLSYSVKVDALGINGLFIILEKLVYHYKIKDQIEVVTHHMKSPKITASDPDIQTKQLEWHTNKTALQINDEISYTLKIRNKGNTAANNIRCRLCAEEGLEPCQQQDKEYVIDYLLPGDEQSVMLGGRVASLPKSEQISAKAEVCYEFYKTPNSLVERVVETEWLNVPVYTAGPLYEASWGIMASKEVAGYDEEISLKIVCKNEGNQVMKNTMLYLQWEDRSPLLLEKMENENIVLLGDILSGESYVLEVKGRVATIPKDCYVNLNAVLNYQFISDEKCTMKEQTLERRIQLITIKDCGLSNFENIALWVDKNCATLDELLTYHLKLSNKGNTVVKNIKIFILPCTEATYVENSFQVLEGICEVSTSNQLQIPFLEIGEVTEVVQQFKVNAIPTNQYAVMNAYIIYDYRDGYEKRKICERQLPYVETKIESVDFSGENLVKKVNYSEVTLGEEITYEIICRNQGNVKAEEVYLKHQFPKGLSPMSETITINQSKKEQHMGVDTLYLGNIAPGKEVKIGFQAYVERLEEEDCAVDHTVISYICQVGEKKLSERLVLREQQFCIKAPNLKLETLLRRSKVIVGERMTYHIILSNEGNVSAQDVMLENILTENMMVVEDSIYIQGMNRKDLTTLQDIVLAQIQSKEKVVIDFETMVKKDFKAKSIHYVPKIRYSFNLRGETHKTFTEGERIVLDVDRAELQIYQTTDKENNPIEVGDEINYIVKLINSGTLKTMQMNFFNHFPEGVKFIHGSFKINNKSIGTVDLENGITIGELEAEQTLILSYKVRVEAYYSSQLKNLTYITYGVQLQEKRPIQKRQTDKIVTTLKLLCPNEVKFSCKSHITLPYTSPDCERIVDLEAKVSIIDIQNTLEDNKEIIIKGLITYTLAYISILEEKEFLTFKKVFLHQMKLLKLTQTPIESVQVINYKVFHTIINPRELQLGIKIVLNEV